MTTEYLNNKTFESIIIRFQQSKKSKLRSDLIIQDLRETIHRKEQRKIDCSETHLLLQTNLKLHDHIILEFNDSQKVLATAFYTLSENIVRYTKFNLIDDDDAIQEGVMICFEKIDRFDPRKGKAFNYMTTCILNHFRQLYRSARNYNELKKKYHEFMSIKFENTIIKPNKTGHISGQTTTNK